MTIDRRTLLGTAAAGAAAGLTTIATGRRARAQAPVVKLGVLNDQSGPYRDIGGMAGVAAVKQAVAEFGADFKVEVVSADHQNKPDVGAGIARQWFDRDGVQAIADGGTSAASLAVQDLVRQNHRIFLVSGAGAADLSDRACAPTSVQWTQDSNSTANGVVAGVWQRTKAPWFFLTADYAFGLAVEEDARARLAKLGGTVAGSVKAPLSTTDFSAFLLQAQASGAKVLAVNLAGANVTALKQAAEFGLAAQGMTIVPMSMQNVDVKAAGLDSLQGSLVFTSFFEDATPAARAWSDRYYARTKAMPSQIQAGVYSAVRHYLQAVKDSHSDDGDTVMAAMRATPISDAYAAHGTIRADQRLVHDMYLTEVKKPSESKGPWDLVKLVAVVPPGEAFRPLAESHCPLVK